MNITPSIRSITEYAMKLSEQDAQEAVADPGAFGARLAEQLRAAGVPVVSNGNGHAKAARKVSKVKRAKPKTKGGVTCPDCGQVLVTQGMLERHQRQKHGREKQATDIF